MRRAILRMKQIDHAFHDFRFFDAAQNAIAQAEFARSAVDGFHCAATLSRMSIPHAVEHLRELAGMADHPEQRRRWAFSVKVWSTHSKA